MKAEWRETTLSFGGRSPISLGASDMNDNAYDNLSFREVGLRSLTSTLIRSLKQHVGKAERGNNNRVEDLKFQADS
jgi:hypothetical protein